MTEKEQESLAAKIAKIVIREIDKRQDEYDKEFVISMAAASEAGLSPVKFTDKPSDLEILLAQKNKLEKDIASAIHDEKYEIVGPLKNELALMNHKIQNLK
ncbi:MAG: hypothetical protein N2B06_05940 [Clostridium sp.]|jgi:hypothetical protein|tara:strand:- start:535 stop:837 length:303 start_codon:yes stop_codon:yes gene_type:complete